ncbi:putative F-box/LRR-repeat protein isoform X2 [Capsicum annuum]
MDRDYLGRLILGLLTWGGIDFLRKRLLSKKEEKASTNVHDAKMDYASQLPDEVLSYILERMTLKDVVKTSILSRRWRYVFASMAKLRFSLDTIGVFNYYLDHTCHPYYQRKFLQVVNQFLQLYLGRRKVVVDLEMHIFIVRELSSEFGQLMHSVSQLGVERLHLNFSCGKFFPTSGAIDLCPNMFFEFSLELLSQASSLKYLSLSVCIVKPSVTLRLNSLKSLFLTSVLVKSGQLESILSSCLNLSQLIIKHCKLPLELCISGAVRTVLFADCGGLKEIDLQATNLRRFECLFDDKVRFYFSSVPSLERVKIGLRGDASMPYIFGEFATNIPAQVKSLIVTAFYTQATHLPTEMQIFGNLRMLALLFESTYDSDIVKVSPVLDACPVLQYLDILQHKTYRQKARGSHIRSPLSPTYHTELKEVRFGGFHGTREEIELAIYILTSATVLDQMLLSQYSIGPYYKAYYGHDIWEKREPERVSIQHLLLGQAVSSSTVVIIQ